MHVAEAKRQTRSNIPWICDNMSNDIKHATGNAPNGEFVIDPDGVIVRKRFWSNPTTLRADLTELVGSVANPTSVNDVAARFQFPRRDVASGVVPRIDLPAGMRAVRVSPELDSDSPHYVKLRAEASPRLLSGEGIGQLYLGLYLDPLYKVHWNNRAGKLKIEIAASSEIELSHTELEGPQVDADADVDPRQFLIDVNRGEADDPLEITVHYVACDDAETFCLPLSQRYVVEFERDSDGGSRPGIFMPGMFAEMKKMDANQDGELTIDELPAGRVSLYIGHLDFNEDQKIDAREMERFLSMFNNGRGFDSPFDDGRRPRPASEKKTDDISPTEGTGGDKKSDDQKNDK